MAADQAAQRAALMQVRASVSAAFGRLQVALLRELTARLRAGGAQAGQTLPLDALTDQLEAAVRETQSRLDTAARSPTET